MNMLLAASNPLTHVVQHNILAPETGLTWPFLDKFTLLSNQMLMMMVAFGLSLWLLPKAAKMRRGDGEIDRLVPTGFGNAIEGICVLLREQVARPALGKYTDQFVPYIWSAFFFVLTCNLLGLLPLADLLKPVLYPLGPPWNHAIGGTATGNIMVTAALAIGTLLMMVYNGWRLNGMEYVKHFFNGPAYLAWFIALLEVIGLLAKTFALAIRLFANMVAGHILLAVLLSFTTQLISALGAGAGLIASIPVIAGTVAINGLELFVAFLQAYIFTFLTAMFIGQSVVLHHDDEHHDEEHEHADDHAAETAH